MPLHNAALQGLFRALDIQQPVLLGEGSESQTYSYTADKVIKVCKSANDHTIKYQEALQGLYAFLASHDLPFAVPQIEDIRRHEDLVFLVEKRLPGQSLATVYPTLTALQRQKLLRNYLAALDAFRQITLPERSYGPILPLEDVPAPYDDWRQFIRETAPRKLPETRNDLREEGLDVDRLLEAFNQDIESLPRYPEKNFAHGDYFFGNVLVDEQQEISAVLDVSPWSVVGDHLLDIAGSIMFLDLYDFVTLQERQYLTNQAVQRYGAELLTRLRVYKVYYSLLLSDCKLFDPLAYKWSVANLKWYLEDSQTANAK